MEEPEEWRPAPGVDHYLVSSLGRVWTTGGGRGSARFLTGTRTRGYTRLRPGPDERSVLLHRLVCEAFHGPPAPGQRLVRHLDDDRSNNRASNLAWGTDADNYRDAVRNGVMAPPPTPVRRLTAEVVVDLRLRHLQGESIRSLAREIGASYQSLAPVLRGERYRDVPMPVS